VERRAGHDVKRVREAMEGGEGRTERRERAKVMRGSGRGRENSVFFCSSKPLLFTFLKPLAF